MLRFKMSKGLGHVLSMRGPLRFTLSTWPRVCLYVVYSTTEKPAIFHPEGYGAMSAAYEKGKPSPNFIEMTKVYFGAQYGKEFTIPEDWVRQAFKRGRDFCISLSEAGEMANASTD